MLRIKQKLALLAAPLVAFGALGAGLAANVTPASAAVAVSNIATGNGNGQSPSITVGTTAGDLEVVFVTFQGDTDQSITQPAGWIFVLFDGGSSTMLTNAVGGRTVNQAIMYHYAATGDSSTMSPTFASSEGNVDYTYVSNQYSGVCSASTCNGANGPIDLAQHYSNTSALSYKINSTATTATNHASEMVQYYISGEGSSDTGDGIAEPSVWNPSVAIDGFSSQGSRATMDTAAQYSTSSSGQNVELSPGTIDTYSWTVNDGGNVDSTNDIAFIGSFITIRSV